MIRALWFFCSLTFMVSLWLLYTVDGLSGEDAAPEQKPTAEAVAPAESEKSVEQLHATLKERLGEVQTKERELEERERKISDREKLLQNEIGRYEKIIEELHKSLVTQKETETKLTAQVKDLEGRLELKTSDQKSVEEAKKEEFKKIYEKVDSKKAAKIFDSMDTQLAISILSNLNQAKAAEILGQMSADKAKRVTESFLLKTKPEVKGAKLAAAPKSAPPEESP